jgi:hypothetical protein
MVEKPATLSFHKLVFEKSQMITNELSKAKEKIDSICEELFSFTNESYSSYKSKHLIKVKNYRNLNKNLTISKKVKPVKYKLNLHPSFIKIYDSFEQSFHPANSLNIHIESRSRNPRNNLICSREYSLNSLSNKLNFKNTLKNEENTFRYSCFKLSGKINQSLLKADSPTRKSNVKSDSFCYSNTQQSETVSKEDRISSKFKSNFIKVKTLDKIKIKHNLKENDFFRRPKEKPNKHINLLRNSLKNLPKLNPILKSKMISCDFNKNEKSLTNKELNNVLIKLNIGNLRFCKLKLDKDF